MNRTILLATTALIALSTGSLWASSGMGGPASNRSVQTVKSRRTKVLYTQNSNYTGAFISSMDFTSTCCSYNDQGADDFVIPRGKTWKITEVDVSGTYYDGIGPATSENVFFYRSAVDLPGRAILRAAFTNVKGVDDNGSFAITLPNGGVKLKAGFYWVSVVANMFYVSAGQWGWNVNSVQHRNQAAWQNPGGAYGKCQRWQTLEYCLGLSGDLMFRLKGVSK